MKNSCFQVLICILFSLYGCEKEVSFKISTLPSKPVINSFFTPDSALTIHLSKSTDSEYREPEIINNARIDLFTNSVFTERLSYLGDGKYNTPYKPVSGRDYSILVTVPGYGELTAADRIVSQKVAPINPTLIEDNFIDEEGSVLDELQFVLPDPPGEQNYYEIRIIMDYSDSTNLEYIVPFITSTDPSITQEGDLYYYPESLLFTDQLFDGQ